MGAIAQELTGNSSKDMYERYRRDNRAMFDAQGDALTRARNIADRPYEEYQGQRVAGLSGNERQASTMAQRAADGPARQYLDKAGGMIDSVANSEWNTDTARKFMNPYTDVVLDSTLRREKEAYGQDLKTLQGQAKSRGAFGGDRQTMLESGLRKDHLETVGDLTSRGMYDAYNNASQMWMQDNNRKLAASDAYRAVGGDISRMDSAQITDLMRTGQANRIIEQMQLDSDYGDFIERRDWDVTNLQPLLQAIGTSREGKAIETGQSTGAGQVIGAVASIVGMFGGGGGGSSAGSTGNGMGTAAPITGFDGGSGSIGTGMDGSGASLKA